MRTFLFWAFLSLCFITAYAQAPIVGVDLSNLNVCLYDTVQMEVDVSNYDNSLTGKFQISSDNSSWSDLTSSGPSYYTLSYTGHFRLIVGTGPAFSNPTYYRCVLTNSQGTTTSSVAMLSFNSTLLTNSSEAPITVCSDYGYLAWYPGVHINHAACAVIDSLTPSGANTIDVHYTPITSCVTVDPAVPTYNGIPYVQRRYNVNTLGADSTKTATLTLYYSQGDFDNYNLARGTLPALPTGPEDIAGISNLRVTQYHGAGTIPGTYLSTAGEINPDDNLIVWNANVSRWEVTFSIVGFSGFFISTGSLIPLPLKLLTFIGDENSVGNNLIWTTTSEINVSYFDIERSEDAITFNTIGKKSAINGSALTNQYNYQDVFPGGSTKTFYYRLNMVDMDGKQQYSKILVLRPFAKTHAINVTPNPFSDHFLLQISSLQTMSGVVSIADASGRIIYRQKINVQIGENNLIINGLADLQIGVYVIRVYTKTGTEVVKLVKGN